jgi:signal peptidase I
LSPAGDPAPPFPPASAAIVDAEPAPLLSDLPAPSPTPALSAPVPAMAVAGAGVAAVTAGAVTHAGTAMTADPRGAFPGEVHRAAPSAWDRFAEELITWFKTLASAAVYATLIVTFVCQVARVEGQSMAPTLEDQDRLIVNKFVYRIGDPRKNDIVMLYYPVNPDKSFVKRIIAEPNDEVHIVDGRVYVNNLPVKDEYVPPQYKSHEDYGPMHVREGYYFVMGDHRNNSSDSRHWGEVPKKYIIGKVQLRWWPLPTARIFE